LVTPYELRGHVGLNGIGRNSRRLPVYQKADRALAGHSVARQLPVLALKPLYRVDHEGSEAEVFDQLWLIPHGVDLDLQRPYGLAFIAEGKYATAVQDVIE